MKTTDSVKEKFIKWLAEESGEPEHLVMLMQSVYVNPESMLKFYSHSLAEARREVIDKVEQLKWEPKGCDETYWYTRGDDVIRSQVYFEAIKDVLDLLTGDNPEESYDQPNN